MSEGTERRDEVLRRLVLEEADPLAAFGRSELAGDTDARAELEELLAAERRVAALGAGQREALRAPAPGSADAAAEERVLAAVRERLGAARSTRDGPPPGSHLATHRPTPPPAPVATRRSFGPRVAALVAAAAVLALGLRWLAGGETGPDSDTRLGGGGSIEVERPRGAVEAFDEIAWRGARPDGGHFVVHVLDATSGGGEVATSPPLEQNRWSPAEDEWTHWPDEIRIYVEAWGGGPDELLERSPEVRARRSR